MSDSPALDHLNHLAATAQLHRSVAEGDSRMVWRRWGQGPDVVLLHGGAGSWMHWVRNIATLARDHAVWVPDMPGFGESDLPREELDADAIAPMVLAGAREVIGGPFDLVGFSFGSLVAAHMAALPSPEIRRLVLVGLSGLGIGNPVPEFRSVRRAKDAVEREAALRFNLAALMVHDPACIEADAVLSQENGSANEKSKGRKLARTDVTLRLAGDWKAPVFAVWGSRDKVYDGRFDELRQVLRQLPLRRLDILEGPGHWVQYEGADRFNPLLRELLSA